MFSLPGLSWHFMLVYERRCRSTSVHWGSTSHSGREQECWYLVYWSWVAGRAGKQNPNDMNPIQRTFLETSIVRGDQLPPQKESGALKFIISVRVNRTLLPQGCKIAPRIFWRETKTIHRPVDLEGRLSVKSRNELWRFLMVQRSLTMNWQRIGI